MHRRRRSSAQLIESLESRVLLSAAEPTPNEQYLIELINRARANPTAEAASFGIDLNEGLSPGTISNDPKQPLAVNPYITDAARGHSQHMLDVDQFDHDGIGDGTPYSRMSDAGFVFVPPAASAENIAWSGSTPSVPDTLQTIDQIHHDLFVDTPIPDRGHRLNLMDPNLREVGTGIVTGEFTSGFTTYNSVMVTQDFADSTGNPFLTGVVYRDTTVNDDFYTPGEGIGGVTITATDLNTQTQYSTTSLDAGGYSLALPPGTYRVVASDIAIHKIFRVINVGADNVKLDFTSDSFDVGLYRGSAAHFFFDINSNHVWDGGDRHFVFGLPNDQPIVGDWNGDGTLKAGVYRNGLVFLDTNGNAVWDAGDSFFAFGQSGDTAIVGDWNRDGIDDIGVHRGGYFSLDINGNHVWDNGTDVAFAFGLPTDTPLSGDWNGDGFYDVGVYRSGLFFLDANGNRVWNAGDRFFAFGLPTDRPVIGDWGHDGHSKMGVFRDGRFFLDTNGNDQWDPTDDTFIFGLPTDLPLAGL
ncbi:MAG: carboxypeptidase regulatory-like domain-containing protein [Phycisphaerales bacterium]|nr:carboxypeptidase regulatory-like domain-containing protein [Phycisphaerales bacterium]